MMMMVEEQSNMSNQNHLILIQIIQWIPHALCVVLFLFSFIQISLIRLKPFSYHFH